MKKPLKRSSFVYIAMMALLTASPGLAAEGIELIGYGARQKALGGGDIADSRDAMSMSINPAGIVGLDSQFQAGGTLLLPDRGYEGSGPLVVLAPGYVKSGEPVFPVPNGGFIRRIDEESAWGVVVFGNGGINTAYSINNYKPAIRAPNVPTGLPSPPFPSTLTGPLIVPSFGGPFGDGFAGIDLRQVFVSLDYARQVGPVKIGIAPTLVTQILNIQGLQTLYPYSWDPYHLSNNGYDWSFGGGVRVGLEYSILPNLRLALAGATPMWMTSFAKYSGALADHGSLDVPASVNAGLAFDATPDLTLMAGWRHIFYHEVHSLGASSFPIFYGQLGTFGGPGLGWRDTDMASFGLEWRAWKPLTLRLGYAYSTPMIGGQDITLNVLAPAISRNHISGGFKYEIDKNQSIDFATVYAFKSTVSGPENQFFASFAYTVPAFGIFPGATIPVTVPPTLNPYTKVTAWLSGLELSLSWTYKFDAATPQAIAAKF